MYVLKHISYPSHAKRVMTQFWTISKHKSSNVILYTQLNSLPIEQNEKRKKIGWSGCETVTIAKMAIFLLFYVSISFTLSSTKHQRATTTLKILTISVSVQGSSVNSFFTLKVVIQEKTNDDLRSRRPEDTHHISRQRLPTASTWDPRDLGQNCRLHQLV